MTPFEFRPGASLAHALDPRTKLLLVCLTSLSLLSAGFPACLMGLALLMAMLHQIRVGPMALVKQLKLFIVFLVLIILVRALTTPGDVLISYLEITVTRQGLIQGSLVALRFFLVMVVGIIFAASTPPADLKAAIQWILAPVPFVPEKRVGMMISLSLRFLPMILNQARETNQAIQARCGSQQKNPVKRMTDLGLALMRKTILSADAMALSMEARCYSEVRTDPVLTLGPKDPPAIAVGICLSLLSALV